MGYESAGAIGVKMAAPDREVYSLVGDGSYLMLSSELVTALQEAIRITVVLVDNHGYGSIGGLSRSLGLEGFGTQHRYRRDGTLGLDGEKDSPAVLPIDFASNAASLGAHAIRAKTIVELREALAAAKHADRSTVIVVDADRYARVPRSDGWRDGAVAERSGGAGEREARGR